MLVDNTAGHEEFSPSWADSRVTNQINMAEEDREKTTFITEWGTFCYKVMPFGLNRVNLPARHEKDRGKSKGIGVRVRTLYEGKLDDEFPTERALCAGRESAASF
ncbi:Unknown protein [Striga hermonthica]|uniref:Uncharacterized protein n=1 Tax=Striga hermonthica TaxID=68872 RepID=A0A9N7NS47_STRHE|nr:Unknown protein [Striga hermonthica]